MDMQDPDVQALDLRNTASKGKAFLGVVEDDTIKACGPIWTRSYNQPDRTLQIGAKGLMSLFDHRLVIPLLAESLDVTQWTIPDLADNTKTIANPLLTTQYTAIWWGTMAKRLVQQTLARTGGNLPIVFQADEIDGVADHTKTYLGVDFKPVGEALKQLTELQGGVEINFAPRFTTDGLGVEWFMQTGTVAQPLIYAKSVSSWNVTVDDSPVSDFQIDEDGTMLGSFSWGTGGRQADDVLVSRAYDSTLIDQGFPMMEIVDSSHSTVSIQSTLDKYAAQNAINGRGSEETWSFTVEARPTDDDGNPAGPWVNSYNVGDFCDITIAPYHPTTGVGDPYLTSGGTFRRRIVSISADEKGETVKIKCVPEVVS
ncbi:hypothetical protein ATY41_04015 [Leifsonia xyli subsp. xyli]|nr:hypothetical protein [Leifsonia xyli]ODA89820.1 hypothetical protein ATY41_04015 [Leifsonia xyli subsp. xyli]